MLHEKNCDFSISIDFDRLGACVSKQDADSSCFLEPLMMSSPPHQLETYLVPITVSFFFVTSSNGDPLEEHLCFISSMSFFRSTRTWRLHLLIVTLHEESELLKHIRCCRWKSFWKGHPQLDDLDVFVVKWLPFVGAIRGTMWYPCLCLPNPSAGPKNHQLPWVVGDAFEVMKWWWTKPNCKHSNKIFRSSSVFHSIS